MKNIYGKLLFGFFLQRQKRLFCIRMWRKFSLSFPSTLVDHHQHYAGQSNLRRTIWPAVALQDCRSCRTVMDEVCAHV